MLTSTTSGRTGVLELFDEPSGNSPESFGQVCVRYEEGQSNCRIPDNYGVEFV